jgi:glycosyltransferase involved in cell wall biosynthesis
MGNGMVSIIVPCYNQADYLPETLESILAQTDVNWECVIVNDGSPDNTDEVVQRYLVQDNRFKYIKQSNKGPAAARNAGIENSCGEFILPLDADDLIAPTYLEKAVAIFAQNADTKLVYCKADIFGLEKGPWNLDDYNYDSFIWKNCIFCSAMYKRNDYLKTGGYNVNMTHGLEDWDFFLSLLGKNDVVHCIDETLFYYRVKERSRTKDYQKQHFDETMIQICKNHPEIYDPFKERVLIYHNELQKKQKELQQMRHMKDSLENSYSYRLGRFLLKPFFWFKRK